MLSPGEAVLVPRLLNKFNKVTCLYRTNGTRGGRLTEQNGTRLPHRVPRLLNTPSQHPLVLHNGGVILEVSSPW